jgi:transcriptional regulator with XRE-family HTH domain
MANLSARTRALYRRRLQNRIHRLILGAFRDQQKKTGLTQKQLAARIAKDKSKVNHWLGVPSNLTLETISDLLLGIGVDLDHPSVTPMADLVHEQANVTSRMSAATSDCVHSPTSGDVTRMNDSSSDVRTSTTAGLPVAIACLSAGAISRGCSTRTPWHPILRAMAA